MATDEPSDHPEELNDVVSPLLGLPKDAATIRPDLDRPAVGVEMS